MRFLGDQMMLTSSHRFVIGLVVSILGGLTA
jgi:hypothetical protein